MTLLKGNDYKDINVALLSLEADIKKLSNNGSFDSSAIDRQLAEINSRIDKINAGGNNSSAAINDIRTEIEDINSKLNGNSVKIENIEQKLSDIFSAENKVTDFNATTDSGVYYWVTDAANRPTDYGVLLVNKYDGGSGSLWINQIAYGTNGKIYFRQNIDSGNWTEWKAVAFDGEITAKKVANALTVNGKTYDGSRAVDAGVQLVENGGTGATTALGAFESLANGLPEDVNPLDGEHIIFQYENKKNWGRYTTFELWNYIKNKISNSFIKYKTVTVGNITIPSVNYIEIDVGLTSSDTIISAKLSSWGSNTGAFSIICYAKNRVFIVGNAGTNIINVSVQAIYI